MAKFKIEDIIQILAEEYDILPKKDPKEEEDPNTIDLEYEKKIKKEPPTIEKPKLSDDQKQKIIDLARERFKA